MRDAPPGARAGALRVPDPRPARLHQLSVQRPVDHAHVLMDGETVGVLEHDAADVREAVAVTGAHARARGVDGQVGHGAGLGEPRASPTAADVPVRRVARCALRQPPGAPQGGLLLPQAGTRRTPVPLVARSTSAAPAALSEPCPRVPVT
ncbi:hypothetical protein GCM10010381_42120 [Streptomyces xantholiticus]|nr:hypothetical protein GCM10010381_42120 [Streptomyces xantholiticus]